MNGASSDGTHRDRPTKHDSWERTIGVCSVVIAVCALVATLWQEASSREHNRLSVRPILDIVIGLASDSSPAGVSLENRGVGPAIIRTSNVFRGDAPIGSISTNTWNKFLIDTGVGSDGITISRISPGTVMAPGASLPLIRVQNDEDTVRTKLADAVSALQLKICYCSVYEECWVRSLAGDGDPVVSVRECDPSSVALQVTQ